MAKKKRKTHKVGATWSAIRKINGKRRKVFITKKSKTKYKTRVASKKKVAKKRRRR